MIVGVDGNEANVESLVGVSVYTHKLLEYFQEVASKNLQFKIFLRSKPLSTMPPANSYFAYYVVGPSILWSQIALPYSLYRYKPDVFFAPAHYSPQFCQVPLVVTIHDLSYFYYPSEFLKKDLYKLKNWTANSIRKAKHIIAVSENTRMDLLNYYHISSQKITVIHNGYEKAVSKKVSDSRFSNQESPYILYVGTLQPRKNIPTLIRTFSRFIKKHPKYKLLLVGKKGWLYDKIFAQVKQLSLTDKVIFTGYVSDSELIDLYRNAKCFVLPSLYEGFGIPILEAMANKCPVVCSNTSSLPEIGGDAALYFNPVDEKELLKHLATVVENKDFRQKLIMRGLERVKKFSWQESARKTLEVITQAA